MGPGRSPSRLRSKTADFSDLLRGSPHKQSPDSAIPPVPSMPPSQEATTPKSKRKLTGFLGLKRKSGGLALSSEPGARELRDGTSRAEDPVPAVPDELLNSRISTGGFSLPSSLPPLNVSPPSFGAHFAPSSSPSKSRFSSTNPPQSDSEVAASAPGKSALRVLRTQKSVSFEVSRPFNVTHSTASAMPNLVDKTKKPVITISAPPGVDPDFNAPRTAPTPPSTASSSKSTGGQGHSRRPLGFSFGHHKKDDAKEKERVISRPITEAPLTPMQNRFAASPGEKPSPTPSLSPIMRFPVPPNQGGNSSDAEQTRDDEALTGAFSHSPSSTLSPTVSPHTVTPSDLSDRSPTPRPTHSTPSRPPRPTSLILPSPSSSKRSSSSKVPESPASSTGRQSLRVRSRKSSRSASPASPPPKDPLPSPPTSATFPSSDTEGWTTDASTTIGGWTTDASSRMGSVGTIPSLASRRSVASAARLRANTIAVVHASKAASAATSSGDEVDYRKTKSGRSDMSHCIPSIISSRHAERKESTRDDKSKERTRADTLIAPHQPPAHTEPRPQTTQGSGDATPTREESPSQSLRAAHDTFVRMLREKHAAEKAELLKRIERLEKEARRREREIKGLRWLIMNANADNGGAGMLSMEDQLVMGRLRSGSKASDFSAASSGRSRSSSVLHSSNEQEEALRQSPERNSLEEGLKDLQDTVSDLIAPNVPHHSRDGDNKVRPDSPPEGSVIKNSSSHAEDLAARRSSQSSSQIVSSESSKSSIAGGLGFDIPTIPGSDSDVSLMTAESMSLPSLTAANTSSTLSVIPEAVPVATPESEHSTKEEKRSSRIFKRLSASASAQAAYATNLKIGMSPSIEQVLDRTRELEHSGMDDVLKKLRAFGGSSS